MAAVGVDPLALPGCATLQIFPPAGAAPERATPEFMSAVLAASSCFNQPEQRSLSCAMSRVRLVLIYGALVGLLVGAVHGHDLLDRRNLRRRPRHGYKSGIGIG